MTKHERFLSSSHHELEQLTDGYGILKGSEIKEDLDVRQVHEKYNDHFVLC